jgi:hypothetical protein
MNYRTFKVDHGKILMYVKADRRLFVVPPYYQTFMLTFNLHQLALNETILTEGFGVTTSGAEISVTKDLRGRNRTTGCQVEAEELMGCKSRPLS